MRAFIIDQARRVWLRWIVLKSGLIALAFWTVLIAGYVWLDVRGLGIFAATLLLGYLYLLLPSLMAQVQLVLDVVHYWLFGHTRYYASLYDREAAARLNEAVSRMSPTRQRSFRAAVRVLVFIADTSPLSGLAMWAMIVLLRMPDHAHAPRPATRRELREVVRKGRSFERTWASAFALRTFARSA